MGNWCVVCVFALRYGTYEFLILSAPAVSFAGRERKATSGGQRCRDECQARVPLGSLFAVVHKPISLRHFVDLLLPTVI